MKFLMTAVAMLAMCQPALATAYVCVEESSLGYAWNDGKWTPYSGVPTSYILRKGVEGDPATIFCFLVLENEGQSLTKEKFGDDGETRSWGCYVRAELGKEAFHTADTCREYYDKAGSIFAIKCDDIFRIRSYNFEPNGEFVFHYPGSIASALDAPEEERVPALMSVGKCNLIER